MAMGATVPPVRVDCIEPPSCAQTFADNNGSIFTKDGPIVYETPEETGGIDTQTLCCAQAATESIDPVRAGLATCVIGGLEGA